MLPKLLARVMLKLGVLKLTLLNVLKKSTEEDSPSFSVNWVFLPNDISKLTKGNPVRGFERPDSPSLLSSTGRKSPNAAAGFENRLSPVVLLATPLWTPAFRLLTATVGIA